MKKVLLFIIILIFLFLISSYFFIPKQISPSNTQQILAAPNAINRFLMEEQNWSKWWPGTVQKDATSAGNIYHYKNFNYMITSKSYNLITVQATGNNLVLNENIYLLSSANDTAQIDWKYSLSTNNNPINRINLLVQTTKINNELRDILERIKVFFSKNENIYGLTIDQIQVTDTLLISSKFSSLQQPSTERIYAAIDSIKNYIISNSAQQTNAPMLHVWKDSGIYKTTIAIPLNKDIPGNKKFYIKRMVPGKILVAEVKGGAAVADEGLQQLGLFVTDNSLSSPAIPFESLITDRIKEKDSSKWITKLYYPVF